MRNLKTPTPTALAESGKWARARLFLIAAAVAAINSINAAAPSVPQGVITAKGFLDISGTALTDLTGNAKFPNSPDVVHYYPYFEWNATGDIGTPANNAYGDNYGAQMLGYFYPPASGDYVFWFSSDDAGALYLSTDDTAANKKLIAQESTWSNARSWDARGDAGDASEKNSSTFAATGWPTKDAINGGAKIALTKGKIYYIEAICKEGGGGDNLAVAVAAPDGSIDQTLPIPGQYLSSSDKTTGPLKITAQPKSQTVDALGPVTLSVDVDGTPPYTYQWMKNGSEIADATNRTYVIGRATAADNAKYKVTVTGAQGTVTSDEVTLTVNTDTTPPTLVSAGGSVTFDTVTVTFSEPLNQASAETTSNYQLSGGLTISSATLYAPSGTIGDNKVVLKTSKQAEGATLTLTVSNVKDLAGNVLAASSKVNFKTFTWASGYVLHKFWDNFAANNIAGLIADPRFPDAPTMVTIEPMWEWPPNGGAEGGSNYGNQLSGWFVPPKNGDYIFFTSSDDPSDLYLSTDADPANKKLIAHESGWDSPRNWTIVDSGSPSVLEDKRSDTFASSEWLPPNVITLTAGKKYYLESLHTEGSGGDNVGATYIMVGAADPANASAPTLTGSVIGTYLDPNGASVTIAKQPQSATIAQNQTATLAIEATGTSAYGTNVTYRWQKAPRGSSAFTDIAGANASSFTTPVLTLADDGIQYRVTVSVPAFATNSAVATITVSSDAIPPTVVSAAAMGGTVGVGFDGLMDATSATVPGNYTLTGGTVTAAKLRPDGKSVILTVTGLSGTEFTLAVASVKDKAGNVIAAGTSVKGKIITLKSQDVGTPGTDPIEAGSTFPLNDKDFDMLAGGSDYWNNADGFQFAYEEKTGDFDLVVQIAYIDRADNWTHGGLMARETLDAGSRYVNTVIDPSAAQNGQNVWEANYRADTDGAAAGLPGYTQVGPLPYPNVWVRLQRKGDTFTAFRGTNGVDWIQEDAIDQTYPAKIYVGMATTAHNNTAGVIALCKYRNYGAFPYVPPATDKPVVSISRGATGLTITYTGALQQADIINGPYTDVAGATSPYAIGAPTGTKFFRARQ